MCLLLLHSSSSSNAVKNQFNSYASSANNREKISPLRPSVVVVVVVVVGVLVLTSSCNIDSFSRTETAASRSHLIIGWHASISSSSSSSAFLSTDCLRVKKFCFVLFSGAFRKGRHRSIVVSVCVIVLAYLAFTYVPLNCSTTERRRRIMPKRRAPFPQWQKEGEEEAEEVVLVMHAVKCLLHVEA